jgi:hypothetical protein
MTTRELEPAETDEGVDVDARVAGGRQLHDLIASFHFQLPEATLSASPTGS